MIVAASVNVVRKSTERIPRSRCNIPSSRSSWTCWSPWGVVIADSNCGLGSSVSEDEKEWTGAVRTPAQARQTSAPAKRASEASLTGNGVLTCAAVGAPQQIVHMYTAPTVLAQQACVVTRPGGVHIMKAM